MKWKKSVAHWLSNNVTEDGIMHIFRIIYAIMLVVAILLVHVNNVNALWLLIIAPVLIIVEFTLLFAFVGFVEIIILEGTGKTAYELYGKEVSLDD